MRLSTASSCSPRTWVWCNWFDAVKYCRVLNHHAGLSESVQCYEDPESLPEDAEGNRQRTVCHLDRPGFRLLTEAEWEYACRAGMRTAYSFGSDRSLLRYYAWFQDNSQQWLHAVGQLRPNLRGLFDVHGNMWEWCSDGYNFVLASDADDPLGVEAEGTRVDRGGSWRDPAAFCRTANRDRNLPITNTQNVGFRIATSCGAGTTSPAEDNCQQQSLAITDGISTMCELE